MIPDRIGNCIHIDDVLTLNVGLKYFSHALTVLPHIRPLCRRKELMCVGSHAAIRADTRDCISPPVSLAGWALMTELALGIRTDEDLVAARDRGRRRHESDSA